MDVVAVQWMGHKAKKLARKWGGHCIVFIDEIDAVGMRRAALGGASAQPMHTEMPMFGPRGTRTASGDVIIESREWRDYIGQQMVEADRPVVRRGPISTIARAVVPGMFGGGQGSGALNQLLVVMDGVDNPPFIRRITTRFVNTLLDASYVVPQKLWKVGLRLPRPKPRNDQVFFIGATNVPLDVLDPALTRAGRMGRQVQFRIPNKIDRADVLDFYLAKVAHTPDLDAEKPRDELARMTAGYSPAMIEQVCSIALMAAHHDGREAFDRTDILTAMGTVESGTVVDFEYTPDELRQIAVHEAGHATVGHVYMGDTHEASRLTIRMRSDGSGGHWMAREKDDRFVHFRSEYFKSMLTTMAALAAEHVFYGENTSGVGGDMSSVAHQAAIMVGHAAMPPERVPMPATMTRSEEEAARKKLDDYFLDTGGKLLAVASLSDHYAEALTRPDKRQLAARIVGHAYLVAYKFAEQNKDAISRVADELVERRELNGDEITAAHGLAAPEARRRRLPGGAHVATPVTPAAPEAAPVPKVHRRRFALLYVGLAALLVCGGAIGLHLATRTIVKPKPWASWVPLETSPEAKVREIANHVQNLYVAAGRQGARDGARRAALGRQRPGGARQAGRQPDRHRRLQVLRRPVRRVPALRQHDQGQLRDRPEEDHAERLRRADAAHGLRAGADDVPLRARGQERGRAAAGRRQGSEGAHARDRALATSRSRSRSRPGSSRSRSARTGGTSDCRTTFRRP